MQIRFQYRDPHTGEYSTERWSPAAGFDPHSRGAAHTSLTHDAQDLDSTGYGVELTAEVYGVRVVAQMGPTPYESSDGSHMVAWGERLDAVIAGAEAVAEHVLATI